MSLKAEQVILSLEVQLNAMTDPTEKKKVLNWILGVIEEKEQRKLRLHEVLDRKGKYQINKKTKKTAISGIITN